MGDTEAMRQALEHARRVLLKVAHADGDLHGDAWAAVWHADSALASTEAPERPNPDCHNGMVAVTPGIVAALAALPAPAPEGVPEDHRVCSHGIYHHGCPSCDRQDPEERL